MLTGFGPLPLAPLPPQAAARNALATRLLIMRKRLVLIMDSTLPYGPYEPSPGIVNRWRRTRLSMETAARITVPVANWLQLSGMLK
jgi:hypothetical protein